jgi:DNA-binding response OmpR family regulator
MDKVVALSTGADDYLVKPFSPRELLARVRAMLRRPRTAQPGPDPTEAASEPELIRLGDLTMDPAARQVHVKDAAISLTRTEFDLLAALIANPRVVLTRRQLTDAVWGADWFGDDQIVDVHVGHLRRKLGDDATKPRYIRTVRGVGYAMVG